MARKRLKKKSALPKQQVANGEQLLQYEITDEPIRDKVYNRLPRGVRDTIEELHTLAQTKPQAAIPELTRLIQAYPQIPMLYNYLGAAYIHAHEIEKGRDVIRENYEKNPDYLFARINYAQLFLQQRNFEKIAEIFDHKFDLGLLYPNRRRFHVTEFIGFMGVVGPYFLGIGERDLAKNIYQIMKDISPDHALTKQLGLELNAGLLTRWLRRLVGKR